MILDQLVDSQRTSRTMDITSVDGGSFLKTSGQICPSWKLELCPLLGGAPLPYQERPLADERIFPVKSRLCKPSVCADERDLVCCSVSGTARLLCQECQERIVLVRSLFVDVIRVERRYLLRLLCGDFFRWASQANCHWLNIAIALCL